MIIRSIPRLGAASKDVAVIQNQLKKIGQDKFDPGSIDGIFGAKTFRAIQNFQRDVVKTAGTGIIGPKTLRALGIEILAVDPITELKAVTQDLKGKQDRHLHPNTRLLLEKALFPDSAIPYFWSEGDIPKVYIHVCETMAKFGIRERGGNNKGVEIGWIQGTTGPYKEGGNGDAWCLDWAQMIFAIIEDFYQKESPVPGTAHCVTCWNGSKKIPGLTSLKPIAGALALGQNKPGITGHAMPTIQINEDGTMLTCEGNTSIASMTDGDGSGLKTRNQNKNGKLITLGWVMTYPNNKLP